MNKYWKNDRTKTMGDLARAGRRREAAILACIAAVILVAWLLCQ